MKIQEYYNEYKILCSNHLCDTCNVFFSLEPTVKGKGFESCLARECESYDPHSDLDILFKTDDEILADDKVVSLEMLRKRKIFKETGKIT